MDPLLRSSVIACRRCVVLATALGLADVQCAAQANETVPMKSAPVHAPVAGVLRSVRVSTAMVFGERSDGRLVPELVDALHATTRREVVMREVFVQPGDRVDETHAAELERNLRALGIFAEVHVVLEPTSEPGLVDLVVATRDRFSLLFGGGASYVGGVSGFNASIGESNLFGTGNRIVGAFRESSDGEWRGTLQYSDLHLGDTWMRGGVRLSRTDDGDTAGIEIDRPFKHLRDPVSWRTGLAHEEAAAEYYLFGDEQGSVPYRRASLDGSMLFGDGERYARTAVGPYVRVDQTQYGDAVGALAPSLRVPGDTARAAVGASYRENRIDGFRKGTSLDTLGFVQDLAISTQWEVALGAGWRDEAGLGGELQPEADAHFGTVFEPWTGALWSLAADGGLRLGESGVAGWSTSARSQVLVALHERHSFAGQVRFDAVEETQGLLPQLTLGADNGLRGYDAHLLTGTQRLLANGEHRFDTGIEVWVLRLGLCAFVDAGWIGDSLDLGRPYLGAGGGLRLGCPELLGAPVLRADFARSLDEAPGNSGGLDVAITVGQAFTFGGAARPSSSR